MDDEILYPVCPHRNVAAAFHRFVGPDAGGVDRFFDSALERERFVGRHWPYRFAALASMREATQELLALPARQGPAAREALAALQPLAAACHAHARAALSTVGHRALQLILAAAPPAGAPAGSGYRP